MENPNLKWMKDLGVPPWLWKPPCEFYGLNLPFTGQFPEIPEGRTFDKTVPGSPVGAIWQDSPLNYPLVNKPNHGKPPSFEYFWWDLMGKSTFLMAMVIHFQ